MANWYRQLRVATEWHRLRDEEMSIRAFCEVVVTKLTEIKKKGTFGVAEVDSRLTELIDEFKEMSEEAEDPSPDEFDLLWSAFYDWADSELPGDRRRACWVDIA